MNSSAVIKEAFGELEQELERALDGLTDAELRWQPNKEANSINFTFWHLSRAEDVWVQGFALRELNLFESGGWASRWKIPAQDTGFRYGPEQLATYSNPPLGELWSYHREVRKRSLAYLDKLGEADFDHEPPTDNPRRKGYTVGRMWTHLVCEIGQHVGHIWYLRGLQRGINK